MLLRDEVGCTEPVFGKQELKILDLQPLVAACKAEIAVYVRQGDGVLAVALKSLCAPLQRRGNRGTSEWLLEEFAHQVHVQQVAPGSYTAKYSMKDEWQCSLKVLSSTLNKEVQIVQDLSSTFPMPLYFVSTQKQFIAMKCF